MKMKLRMVNGEWRMSPAAAGGHNPPFEIRNPKLGFTLVEIMVAVAVFTLVLGAIYSSWIMVLKSTRLAQDVAAQAQRERVTVRAIEESLMSVQSFQSSPQYYSFVLENGDAPTLSFVSRVPDIFPRNGKFTNPNTGREYYLRRLTFALEAGKDGGKNLVLRQNPVLMDLDDDEKNFPCVLARNVKKFSVECWDTNKLEWVDEWLDTNAIPTLMRVRLALGTTTARASATDVPLTRVLSVPSATMPAFTQNGQGGPGAPGGNAPALKLPIRH